jgi:hypothetical protein
MQADALVSELGWVEVVQKTKEEKEQIEVKCQYKEAVWA